MVQGAGVAGGCELALHCDIRIGSPAAKFIMPLAKLGLVLPCPAAERLVDMAGKTAAADMLLTGDPIDGVRAERIGMLTRLVDADQLETQTEAIVRQIAANAPLSLRAMKAMLAALGSTFLSRDLERFDAERVAISRSQDMREPGVLSAATTGFHGGLRIVMTRSAILAGSYVIVIVTMVAVHRERAGRSSAIPANLTNYLVRFAANDLEKSFPRWALPAAEARTLRSMGRASKDVTRSRRFRSSLARGPAVGTHRGASADAATRKWVAIASATQRPTSASKRSRYRRNGGRRSGRRSAGPWRAHARSVSLLNCPGWRPAASASTSPTSVRRAADAGRNVRGAVLVFSTPAPGIRDLAGGSRRTQRAQAEAPRPCWSCSGCPA
jgi:hypothetical protein